MTVRMHDSQKEENALYKNNCHIQIMYINAYFISKRLIVYMSGDLYYLIRHICLKEIPHYWIVYLYDFKYLVLFLIYCSNQ